MRKREWLFNDGDDEPLEDPLETPKEEEEKEENPTIPDPDRPN